MNISLLHSAYSSGSTTPAKYIAELYERIKAHQSSLGKSVFITVCDWTFILAQLEKLPSAQENNRHLDLFPLYGIPFVLKDNIDVAGLPTTAACPDFEYLAKTTATVAQLVMNSGAILLAKTNLDQFATGLVGVRSPYGIPSCVYDNDYISGGSSSGSAVAVASQLATFSFGTDTAGSGRVPAAFNNLVGLKPSRGLLSNFGVVPACKSLDCVSIFAGNICDAERIFNVVTKFDPLDSYSRSLPTVTKTLGSQFSFAIPNGKYLEFFGDLAAEKSFHETVDKLKKSGGVLIDNFNFEIFVETAKLLYGPWISERVAGLKQFYANHSDSFLPVVKGIFDNHKKFTAADLFGSFHQLEVFKAECRKIFANLDFLIVPSVPTHYRIEEVLRNPVELNSNLGIYTNFVNLLDLSAIAIPTGFKPPMPNGHRLPIGITLIAPAFHDKILISLAKRLEESL